MKSYFIPFLMKSILLPILLTPFLSSCGSTVDNRLPTVPYKGTTMSVSQAAANLTNKQASLIYVDRGHGFHVSKAVSKGLSEEFNESDILKLPAKRTLLVCEARLERTRNGGFDGFEYLKEMIDCPLEAGKAYKLYGTVSHRNTFYPILKDAVTGDIVAGKNK